MLYSIVELCAMLTRKADHHHDCAFCPAGDAAAATNMDSEAKLDIMGDAPAAEKEKHAKLRDAYDGGVVFLAWLKLGPLSEKAAPGLALSAKTTPAPDKGGRKAQREAMNPHEISRKAAVEADAQERKAYRDGKVAALKAMGD
eukprot:3208129-Pleurochrysis_carterae.AAC.1